MARATRRLAGTVVGDPTGASTATGSTATLGPCRVGPVAASDGAATGRAAPCTAQQSGNPSRTVVAGGGGQWPQPGASGVGAISIRHTANRPAPNASAAVISSVRSRTGRGTDAVFPGRTGWRKFV